MTLVKPLRVVEIGFFQKFMPLLLSCPVFVVKALNVGALNVTMILHMPVLPLV